MTEIFIRVFAQLAPPTTGSCGDEGGFFDVPTWYKYLDCDGDNNPQIDAITDVWNIVWGVVDILLYVAGAAAVLFMIYGGIKMIISQGSPDKISQSRQILIYSAVGLVVAIIARTIINYVIGRF